MSEIWKTLKDYPNYQVSNFGRVKSLINSLMLRTDKSKSGYLSVRVYKNTKHKVYRVSRLVGFVFIPNPENKPFINHKDGNKLNNHVINLEWCTQSENIKHAYRTGLMITGGEDSPNHKISNSDAETIRAMYKTGCYFQKEIGRLFDIEQSQISRIVNNKIYLNN